MRFDGWWDDVVPSARLDYELIRCCSRNEGVDENALGSVSMEELLRLEES